MKQFARLFLLLIFACVVVACACNDGAKSIHANTPSVTVDETKTFWVGGESYTVERASDSCEYYSMIIATGAYTQERRYFHYPQCKHCKKEK